MSREHTMQPCLTPGQCAKALGVSDEFIRGEINEGRLFARKLQRVSGRSAYRIPADAFAAYVERHWPAVDVARGTRGNTANPANPQT